MNAGSGERWLGSYFVRGRRIGPDGEPGVFDRQTAGFVYRGSALEGSIITSAEFKFPRINAEDVRQHCLLWWLNDVHPNPVLTKNMLITQVSEFKLVKFHQSESPLVIFQL